MQRVPLQAIVKLAKVYKMSTIREYQAQSAPVRPAFTAICHFRMTASVRTL